jgi:hypothetical protein
MERTITIDIPNDLRGLIVQTDRIMSWRKKFTDQFYNAFHTRLDALRPGITVGRGIQFPGLFIATTTQSIGRLELPEDDSLPDIQVYFYTQDENMNQDVLSSIQGTFDALRAQAGGKRRKTRKGKKSRKNRKTRDRK